MDAQFDLVLILERFDESLVLLQDLMCWPTEDIVYLKQNERIAKGSLFATRCCSRGRKLDFGL